MKKKNLGYRINYTEKIISISKEFELAAGIVGSEEYKVLRQLQQDYPSFEVQNHSHKGVGIRHGGFSFAFMRNYIKQQEDGAQVLKEFDKEIRQYKELKNYGYYGKIKKWFLDKYPHFKSLNVKIAKRERQLADERIKLMSDIRITQQKIEMNAIALNLETAETMITSKDEESDTGSPQD